MTLKLVSLGCYYVLIIIFPLSRGSNHFHQSDHYFTTPTSKLPKTYSQPPLSPVLGHCENCKVCLDFLKRFVTKGKFNFPLYHYLMRQSCLQTPPTSSVFPVSMEEREHQSTFCSVPMLTWRMTLMVVSTNQNSQFMCIYFNRHCYVVGEFAELMSLLTTDDDDDEEDED